MAKQRRAGNLVGIVPLFILIQPRYYLIQKMSRTLSFNPILLCGFLENLLFSTIITVDSRLSTSIVYFSFSCSTTSLNFTH